ncbi:MAG: helix-turn-helix transcriptional regulator [Planctomycetales bacterium]|nr:helix-turn-helix transcriptional regulator [Planctomycetales bacterium]MCA9219375.1 helix-turn-helix transcriptional regulator [Planctomycetales bacterium]
MRGATANAKSAVKARQSLGLTQEELARLADVDVKTVRKAEHGGRLDLDTFTKLAFALQTDLNQLSGVQAR